MSWRVLLVDDEPLARVRLRKLLGEAAEQVRVGPTAPGLDPGGPADAAADAVGVSLTITEAENAAQALQAVAQQDFDLLLLDIQLPGQDGLSLAAQLRASAHRRAGAEPALVFVTAHAEHALAAFDVQALDYLTKPVRRDRLLQALQRCWSARAVSAPPAAGVLGFAPGALPEEPVVVVQDRGQVVRVPAGEILWLRAELKYVTLRTAGHSWLVDESLAELEPRLGRRFLRVHRNALVAVAAMQRLARGVPGVAGGETRAEVGSEAGEAWVVQVMPTGEWLAVSRRQVAAVRACLARGATVSST